MPIKVLVVDDSALIRQVLSRIINEDPEIEVIGFARDGVEALDKIIALKPDVVTLDIEMPRMNGLECLGKIMNTSPLPVIIVSYLAVEGAEHTLAALELGAVEFVTKPSSTDPDAISTIQNELTQKIKISATIPHAKLKTTHIGRPVTLEKPIPPVKVTNPAGIQVIAIGASTGGPRTLSYLLESFPKDFPLGIVVAQHMPKGFTKVFASRLNERCEMEVIEAQTGDVIKPGRILIAPSGYQTKVVKKHQSLEVEVFDQPNLLFKPSVDLLFKSIALTCRDKALAVILTGMGSDGAAGMKELRSLGARTIAEAEESCVVYGMPRTAVEMGAVEYIDNLSNIFNRMIDILS
ncbi:MAG: chemotaxis response regulator protein-glutamate methylesterase [Firmicutes bacterium]|nr:chemotaxis response regulator protein-glutamate methylesterase [Bacillota bacterium]